MKILYVTSEANPFMASGGLGDVMGALPVALAKENCTPKVSVIMPLYSKMKEEYRQKLEKVADISFNLAWRNTGASVYKIQREGVDYLFLENHYYFDRPTLYGEFDDGERFAFFSMAVIEYMIQTDDVPDILHANDWQSALSVIYLKTKYSSLEKLSKIRTVYTIHNIEYQGKFDSRITGDVFALDGYENTVEYDGCANLMKGAICLSDFITTVSPNYAYELNHAFFAFGLQDIIRASNHKLKGVINGIDYGYFSPDKGGDIDFKFTKRTYKSGKAKNKEALCRELGLSTDTDIPLVVMITRLASQKGIDLVLRVAEDILQRNLQFIILGTGEREYEDAFSALSEKYTNFKALIKFDRVISKKMYASADMFLMPSKSEPCGLAQMISCSYGTVPIVRSVGGLCDSIISYGLEGSNGFRFDNYNAHEMLGVIDYALSVYNNKEEWAALVKRALASDFTWKKSSEKYLEIYNNLLNW